MASDFLPAISGYCCWRRAVTAEMLVLALQLCCSTATSTDDWVSLDKRRLTIEEGRTGEATCSTRPGANGTVTWIDPLDRTVSTDKGSRVYYDPASGRLTLSDANVTDSGVYVCALNLTAGCRDESVAPRCNATLHCSVYVMPDYLVDGVVVLAVNAVLISVFVACFVRSVVEEKRRRRKHGMHGMQKLYDAH